MSVERFPLNAESLEERLDEFLDAVLSSRRTAAPLARELARCSAEQQRFILHWARAVASSSKEVAYQFVHYGVTALELMDEAGVEAWLIHAMDLYDRSGLPAAVNVLKEVEHYARAHRERVNGLSLDEVAVVLQTFVAGLSGRLLRVESAEQVYTDTETLFLPPLISHFAEREDNFRLYKATATHLWAQTRFGTWRLTLSEILEQFPDPKRAARLFHALERLRLDARIARELPGLFREMRGLAARLEETPVPSGWQGIAGELARVEATVEDSRRLLESLYDRLAPPPELCYQGELFPAEVEAVMAERLAREKELFRTVLVQLAGEKDRKRPKMEAGEWPEAPDKPRFSLEAKPDPEQPGERVFELHLDGQPMIPPEKVRSLMDSIIQDIGKIPEDYLVPAGHGGYKILDAERQDKDPGTVWQGIYHEEGAFLYNEWDYDRNHYRKNWCVLRELDVFPASGQFVLDTLQRHRGLVKNLRRTFEALRGEDKLLKAQPHGEDLDLDAFVRAYADARAGRELSSRIFTKLHREERNIAVMFMVDMSGSTKGWINDAEREALILLCEALESLGDRYAIYGFSGMTRKRCEIYRVKRFDEPYNEPVRQRISGIVPKDYTRMGVAIRHLSQLLNQVEARIKLLITLSDGRPDDYGDNYRGHYGIEDTRQALWEAKREGIHPFCITLDTEAREYLEHMYGHVNYIVIDEVRKLPLRIADIYRKLTT